MTSLKMAMLFLNYLGWTGYTYVLFINLDNWKGGVLGFLAVVYMGLRIYFYYKRETQASEKRELELKHMKRIDKKEEEKNEE